jgi:SAM-dependent methyltransferase
MHTEAFDFFAKTIRALPRRAYVVEIGSKNINGSLRDLFVRAAPRYVGVDIVHGPDVDVVSDGATFTPDGEPDTVVCAEVLEHTSEAAAICANAHRILAPGGVFVLSAAANPRMPHSAVDGGDIRDGEFYQNVDSQTLSAIWLEPFSRKQVIVDTSHGDVYAVAWK